LNGKGALTGVKEVPTKFMLESFMKKDNDVEKGVGVKMDLISQNL
jgi:hypothetical protein